MCKGFISLCELFSMAVRFIHIYKMYALGMV